MKVVKAFKAIEDVLREKCSGYIRSQVFDIGNSSLTFGAFYELGWQPFGQQFTTRVGELWTQRMMDHLMDVHMLEYAQLPYHF
jgi:hypothetical protein